MFQSRLRLSAPFGHFGKAAFGRSYGPDSIPRNVSHAERFATFFRFASQFSIPSGRFLDCRLPPWPVENVCQVHCTKARPLAKSKPFMASKHISEPPSGQSPEGIIVIIPDALGWTFNNNRILADTYAKRTHSRVYLPEFMAGNALPVSMFASMDTLTGNGWMVGKMSVELLCPPTSFTNRWMYVAYHSCGLSLASPNS